MHIMLVCKAQTIFELAKNSPNPICLAQLMNSAVGKNTYMIDLIIIYISEHKPYGF